MCLWERGPIFCCELTVTFVLLLSNLVHAALYQVYFVSLLLVDPLITIHYVMNSQDSSWPKTALGPGSGGISIAIVAGKPKRLDCPSGLWLDNGQGLIGHINITGNCTCQNVLWWKKIRKFRYCVHTNMKPVVLQARYELPDSREKMGLFILELAMNGPKHSTHK